MPDKGTWERYQHYFCAVPDIGLVLDASRMNLSDDFLSRMEPSMQRAYSSMQDLEAGAISNPDENRMVGHYWLRDPLLAPSPETALEIGRCISSIRKFASAVHSGRIRPQKRKRFSRILSIGIGGSALGPQFVSDALGTLKDKMQVFFLDNTDPDGFDRVFGRIGPSLSETLTLVISKSGGTAETRNGMLEAMKAYQNAGLSFPKHAVAITEVGSNLYNEAINGKWVDNFPMWDWVGGRTSVCSAVGLLPMALQGIDIRSFITGAALCDKATRSTHTPSNPAALLALSWYSATNGKGDKDMVILPYKDRLQLFAKYLQQLIMESLGKEKDLEGRTVNQGISVFGNKGTTDQHAYVQQLRDGVNNFFATFIEVLFDRFGRSPSVESGVTSGDYLSALLQGTRDALSENGRESLTITIDRLDARSLGGLIALYERAVGFYASLVNINAYNQPGVEAGKKMASAMIKLQLLVLDLLRSNAGTTFSADEIASALQAEPESVFRILQHLSVNKDRKVRKISGTHPSEYRFSYAP